MCATAADPAFERSSLAHGIRATDGAVGHIRQNAKTSTLEIGSSFSVNGCTKHLSPENQTFRQLL